MNMRMNIDIHMYVDVYIPADLWNVMNCVNYEFYVSYPATYIYTRNR